MTNDGFVKPPPSQTGPTRRWDAQRVGNDVIGRHTSSDNGAWQSAGPSRPGGDFGAAPGPRPGEFPWGLGGFPWGPEDSPWDPRAWSRAWGSDPGMQWPGMNGANGMGDIRAWMGPWLWLLQVPARMFGAGLGPWTQPPPTGGWSPFPQGPSRPPPERPRTPRSPFDDRSDPTARPGWETRTLSVEVSSRRTTRVEVALPQLNANTTLAVGPLHPIDGAHDRALKVSVDAAPARVRVRVAVPDDQPSGRYAGAVLHGDDRTVLGGLSVDIAEP